MGKKKDMQYSGIGGQAVLEGIMMKNKDQYAVAVRKPDGEIEVEVADIIFIINGKNRVVPGEVYVVPGVIDDNHIPHMFFRDTALNQLADNTDLIAEESHSTGIALTGSISFNQSAISVVIILGLLAVIAV